jgi:hypothetical protein
MRKAAQEHWNEAQASGAFPGFPSGASDAFEGMTGNDNDGNDSAFGSSRSIPSTPRPASQGVPGFEAKLTDLRADLPIHILWGSSWFDGNVVEVRGDSIKVHYSGWNASSDDWVDLKRVRLVTEKVSSEVAGTSQPGATAGADELANSGADDLASQTVTGDFPESEQRRLTAQIELANRRLDAQFKAKFGAWVWSRDQVKMISPAIGKVGMFPVHVVHTDRSPILGANLSWNHGENCIGTVGPVFETASDTRFSVRDGYMISGIVVNADKKVRGLQFVCSRIADGKPNVGDSYTSDWFGIAAKDDSGEKIGGDGRMVYGIWLTQGSRGLESVGLVIDPEK